jgi:flagellar basal-body rod protein FlgB
MSGFKTDAAWLGPLLDATSKRHMAISSNLANEQTPGYRPVRVRFEEMLREVLGRNGIDHEKIASLRPEVVVESQGAEGVAVEEELMAMVKNQLAFDTYTQVLSMKLSLLRTAIQSGRGSS